MRANRHQRPKAVRPAGAERVPEFVREARFHVRVRKLALTGGIAFGVGLVTYIGSTPMCACMPSVARAKHDALQIQQAAELYILQKHACPKDLGELGASGAIRHTIADPWGNDYTIVCPGKAHAVDVCSAGPDGEHGTADDITNANEGD